MKHEVLCRVLDLGVVIIRKWALGVRNRVNARLVCL